MSLELAAVILAAGASRRYRGGNKLLADLGGKPLIRVVVEQVLESAVDDVIVVTGKDRISVETALASLPLRFVYNENWLSGMGGSISLGVSAINARTDGVYVVPGDMPFLRGKLLDSLARVFEETKGARIVFPVLPNGAQRNPVLWPREFFPQLVLFAGKKGAKPLLADYASCWSAVSGFPELVFADVDTREHMQAIRQISLLNEPPIHQVSRG
jgi:molybdenum cofactor cytidylyltransferase